MALPEPPDFAAGMLSQDTFAGQVAMVTGGGSGFGLAMAKAFAQAGAAVGILGRSAEKCAAGVSQIKALGGQAFGVQADVRDEAAVKAAFDVIEKQLGPVSILANNAGGNFAVLAEQMSPNAWRAVTRIAIDGTFICSSELARRLIKRGAPGAIVNNSAHYVRTGFPGDAHSSAAKASIVTMTRLLARDWSEHDIRVNCITAGFFPHENSPSANDPKVGVERLERMIPAGRVGRMQEIGWAAAFLCSPFAEGVNGHALMMDGADSLRTGLYRPDFVAPRHREDIW